MENVWSYGGSTLEQGTLFQRGAEAFTKRSAAFRQWQNAAKCSANAVWAPRHPAKTECLVLIWTRFTVESNIVNTQINER